MGRKCTLEALLATIKWYTLGYVIMNMNYNELQRTYFPRNNIPPNNDTTLLLQLLLHGVPLFLLCFAPAAGNREHFLLQGTTINCEPPRYIKTVIQQRWPPEVCNALCNNLLLTPGVYLWCHFQAAAAVEYHFPGLGKWMHFPPHFPFCAIIDNTHSSHLNCFCVGLSPRQLQLRFTMKAI